MVPWKQCCAGTALLSAMWISGCNSKPEPAAPAVPTSSQETDSGLSPGTKSSVDSSTTGSNDAESRASVASDATRSVAGSAESPESAHVASAVDESVPLIAVEPDLPRPLATAWIPGGHFQMGSPDGFPDELPLHEVALDGFWMDMTEVSVAEFKRFADATGYVTIAEKTPKREDFAGQVPDSELAKIKDEDLVAGSVCFNPKFDQSQFPRDRRPTPAEIYLVWQYVKGANWRLPDGPGSSIEDRMDHPVTHLAWTDCAEYAKWAGKSLPTEAEWEYAARGGSEQEMYPWGNDREPDGRWMTNIWQGEWPFKNLNQDGFEKTAPVASYEPNGYGLFDMSGNVWEWVADWYQPEYYQQSPRRNPLGPTSSFDPIEPGIPKRVQRGGSFMCNANYCTGYRSSARMKGDVMTGTWHCGFRTIVRVSSYEAFRQADGARVVENQAARPANP